MGDKKILAIFIIILALIVMIGLVYFMFLAPFGNDALPLATVPASSETITSVSNKIVPVPVVQNRVIDKKEVGEDELKTIAASFVERYGTYSNQSGYKNIKELDVFMSKNMQAWAAQYVDQALRNNSDTAIYYGITTKAVVVETLNFSSSATKASFKAQTQRVEAIGSTSNERSFQQTAIVDMIREAGIWKVDGVVWEN